MKMIIISLALALLMVPSINTACTLYKTTKNGKTIVGNNEDYLSPNSQFWLEKGINGNYGVMYMGLLNNFAQGAINEAGLVFDGFYEPYLAVNNTQGKVDIPIADAIKKIMRTMHNVKDVKTYLNTINLSRLTNSQIVFVDKSGKYLIVEGYALILGEENEKSFSNFYYSQIKSLDEVKIDFFNRGQKFLNHTQTKPNFDYCAQAMQSFSQKRLQLHSIQQFMI